MEQKEFVRPSLRKILPNTSCSFHKPSKRNDAPTLDTNCNSHFGPIFQKRDVKQINVIHKLI